MIPVTLTLSQSLLPDPGHSYLLVHLGDGQSLVLPQLEVVEAAVDGPQGLVGPGGGAVGDLKVAGAAEATAVQRVVEDTPACERRIAVSR